MCIVADMEYAIDQTSGYKMLPSDVGSENSVPTTCDCEQRDESQFENGDSVVVAPPISRSPEPDSGSDSVKRACVEDPAPPTSTTGTTAVCNISPNYCSSLPVVEYHHVEKLAEPSVEEASVAEHTSIAVEESGGGREDCDEAGSYHSNTNDQVEDHHNNRLLVLGEGGARKRSGSPIIRHQNIILHHEEDQVKRQNLESEHSSPVCLVTSDYQQGESYLECARNLRVIHPQDRFVTLEPSGGNLHQLQDIADTGLYDREAVKQSAGGDSVDVRYSTEPHLEQLTAVTNDDMPYSSTSSSNGLEDLRMRHIVEEGIHVNTDGIILAAQHPNFNIHSQQMRIRGDGYSLGALLPHLTKPLSDPHFNTSQIVSFSIHNHDRESEDLIDKSRSHHHNQINGINDVIGCALKSDEEINVTEEVRVDRSHHQYHIITSPQHPEQEDYLQHHQDSSSPDVSRNGRSSSPEQTGSVLEHIQHHRGEGGRLLGGTSLSAGTASSANNSASNASSFTHLTTLQPSSSSTPSPLGLGGNTTTEGGGGSGSVLQQLSPAGDEEANEHQHRDMYATTASSLEHHHSHHLPPLHSGFHHHDAAAVSSPSALIHSSAANLSR